MQLKYLTTVFYAALSAGVARGEDRLLEPPAPALQWLYTCFVDLATPIDVGDAPHGRRVVYPITGGNFSGPRISGMHHAVISRSAGLT